MKVKKTVPKGKYKRRTISAKEKADIQRVKNLEKMWADEKKAKAKTDITEKPVLEKVDKSITKLAKKQRITLDDLYVEDNVSDLF